MPELATTLQTLSPSRVREAELLADMLRISRLTILYGEAGVGKTTLLLTGVLPLLGRRVADRDLPQGGDSRVVVPFPKCRRRERGVHAEVAIFFNAWNDPPLATLNEQLLAALRRERANLGAPHARLSDNLTAWSRDLGVRFLILFDRFEEYLTAPRDRPGIAEFAEEFLRMLQNPQLSANFLVSVQEYAEPLMERLRASVRGLGDASLRLDALEKRAPAIVQSLHEHVHARSHRSADAQPLARIPAERVEASAAQPLERSPAEPLDETPAEPQLAAHRAEVPESVDAVTPDALAGSEASSENPANLEAAQYDLAVQCELPAEPHAYSHAKNIWATFGAAQHEWTLAFDIAGQTTANPEASDAEIASTLEEPPTATELVGPTQDPGAVHPTAAASEDPLPLEATPQTDAERERSPEEKPSDVLREDAPAEPAAVDAVAEEAATQAAPLELPSSADGAERHETRTDEPVGLEMQTADEPVLLSAPAESVERDHTSADSAAAAEALAASAPLGVPLAPAKPARRRMSRGKWLAAAGAATAVGAFVWTVHNAPLEQLPAFVSEDGAKGQTAPEPAREAAPAEPALPPLPPLPQIALVTEPGNSTDAQAAADLGRLTAAERSLQIAHRADMLSWPDDDAARLAIVRYEALEAANRSRARTGDKSDRLRVVTPLYTEEIHVIARRDSPLKFVHEIRDAKLNVGPSTGSRGLTAARLYERMFGKPIPQANLSFLGDDEALNRLVNDKSIDAMIVVAGQPSAWLAEIPPGLAGSIKLLRHDREHPAGQKAIEAYLPTTIRRQSYGKWLGENTPALATMTFLVGSEGSSAEAHERFDLFAQSFCRNLERLRVSGHPKWREVQLGFDIDTGWPYSARAKSAFQACAAEAKSVAASARR